MKQYPTYFVVPMVSKYLLSARVPSDWVATNKFCIFDSSRGDLLAILKSSLFEHWVRKYSGTMGGGLSISLTKAIQTYPMPRSISQDALGVCDAVEKLLRCACKHGNFGYTAVYNRFHDPDETVADIQKLRDLQVEMDKAVAAAYGWDDLDLRHGFHETQQGLRFTISEPSRREVLQRLLNLNHKRYEEEVRQGLHDKKKGRKRGTRKRKTTQKQEAGLFDMGDKS